MKIVFKFFYSFVILCFFLCKNSLAKEKSYYHRIIVLGDSYSDNGNVLKLTKGKYPNPTRYFKGRFSNGLVWSEYFAEKLNIDPQNKKQFIDLAYGQAEISKPVPIILNNKKQYAVPSLEGQIDNYAHDYQTFKADDLIIVFISTNDFFDLETVNNQTQFFTSLAKIETTQIQRLVQIGAKKIIVFNGRSSSETPLATLFAKNANKDNNPIKIKNYLNHFDQMIQIYNTELKKNLENISEVFIYDIYHFDKKILSTIKNKGYPYSFNHNKYIVNKYLDTCYENNQGYYETIAGDVCTDPESYFYYDRVHNTTSINQILAEDVYHKFIK